MILDQVSLFFCFFVEYTHLFIFIKGSEYIYLIDGNESLSYAIDVINGETYVLSDINFEIDNRGQSYSVINDDVYFMDVNRNFYKLNIDFLNNNSNVSILNSDMAGRSGNINGCCMANSDTHIFLIYGREYYIYDISLNIWINGSSILNGNRYYSSCFYDNSSDMLFVFGGYKTFDISYNDTNNEYCPLFTVEYLGLNKTQPQWYVHINFVSNI